MKTKSTILLMCLSAACLPAAEKPARNLVMRDAPRHEDLAPRFAKEQQKSIKQREVTPAKPPADVSKPYKPVSLRERSDFLSFNGLCTLVPKGSILHVPDNCRERLGLKPGTKIVTWEDFFRRNRGWVTTIEVSRKQAAGDDPLPEQTLKAISKNPRLVVATFSCGPVSVLKKEEPAPEDGAASAGQTAENGETPANSKITNASKK